MLMDLETHTQTQIQTHVGTHTHTNTQTHIHTHIHATIIKEKQGNGVGDPSVCVLLFLVNE